MGFVGHRYSYYDVYTDFIHTDFEEDPNLYGGNSVALFPFVKDIRHADFFFLKEQDDTVCLWLVDRDTLDDIRVRRQQPMYYLVRRQ